MTTTNTPTFAEIMAGPAAPRLTPPEKWTPGARAFALLIWHAEHPGEYLTPAAGERVLAVAYQQPMPRITLEQILSRGESATGSES